MRDLELPPYAPALMESTRAIGYSIETAIADIIDNSVTAMANRIEINFFPVDCPYISILDNGIGMTDSELIEAMRYGSRNPLDARGENDLGRFGLGLKTASMSQCRKLTVISKKGNVVSGAQWDLDYIASTNKWSLLLLAEEDFKAFPHVEQLKELESGTIVIWQELDKLKEGNTNFAAIMGRYMDAVRRHLSLVFHRYIKGESGIQKVEIEINKLQVEAIDPFLAEKSTQIMDDEIINIDGQRVIVRPYLLPHISQLDESEIRILGGEDGIRKQQGFYVYRNKRLLIWGTWFRMMRKGDLSKLARVRIDIPNSLDSLWTLDIKKSMAIPPQIVQKNVSGIIKKLGDVSKRTWTYRGRKEIDDNIIHIWNRLKTREGGIAYVINRDHPIIEEIDSNYLRRIEHLLKNIESGLPLNQLYVDLTSDQKIVNDSEVSEMDLLNMLKGLLSGCNNANERQEMIYRLSITEPFNQHPDLLEKMLQEVK
ncbi:ATP-binding protein [Lederbergia panacisoli]|uniref:ATP-binding protein n=1 Tax=Lederbergia panacisoli TaxID=1255251 RepID=UPI00214B7237|nr:ATP-binding protein [Lederbergia panacisoli]MCR2823321.1 ATP-binding protein [Lederbergia panacisoli]